jgi:hypothetical protein
MPEERKTAEMQEKNLFFHRDSRRRLTASIPNGLDV